MNTRMKKHLAIGTLILGMGITWAAVALNAQGGSHIAIGANIAPVELNMTGLNPALVREGSYIVNAHGGCNDCHTNPSYVDGGNPFLGEPEQINTDCYLAGGTPFGPFVSRNLTLVPERRTLAQFKEVMRTGRDFRFGQGMPPDDTPILQVMPWPVYGKMTDRELEAIYEFLKAIPRIPSSCAPPEQ